MTLKAALIKARMCADFAPIKYWSMHFAESLEASGFVIVPKEATDEMAKASCELDCMRQECQRAGRCRGYPEKLNAKREHWDSMLAARPKAQP